ncbi:hypothetical protein [Variovorax ginsengisoli]|uniref:Uncharacterized protein n=1 Tax=Variovorax ginsengisoli TaxID=363844 RepID=A0ABT9S8Q7_9BURK|nr:hypothetical protein [Variovorax ginsengisoli]MDP9900734.1 hypothetical protein [Variovorax ginsengisoli]
MSDRSHPSLLASWRDLFAIFALAPAAAALLARRIAHRQGRRS